MTDEPTEPIAPLPVLVPYARFHEAQQRRYAVVAADQSRTQQPDQPAAAGPDSADAMARSIITET